MAKWKRIDMRVCVAINRDECGVSLTPNALRNRTQRRHRYQPKSKNSTTLSPVVTQNADGIDFLAEKYTHSNTRSLNSLSSANKTFAFIATEIARIFRFLIYACGRLTFACLDIPPSSAARKVSCCWFRARCRQLLFWVLSESGWQCVLRARDKWPARYCRWALFIFALCSLIKNYSSFLFLKCTLLSHNTCVSV